ncbi:ArsR family transcriptional regulator [Thermus arciformis]|uniref:ArsR family transcriptional regulator n=1 Tax=Thermus arciformis TaxID=482827 RepID=A0A1G7H1K0_9DEIN|nr:metalloregulator ArsR/SmtB family transcription factor [Thermus arciformis]SDE94312.1 ArsR family transcriptional regulator [Thermus arciformis]
MPSALHRYKAEFFKALAHPLRLAILDALREGEKSVSSLQRELGAEQSGLSRQLSLLRERGLVEARREGQMVYYRTRDPEVYAFLDLGRRIFERHLEAERGRLEALKEEA